MYDFTYHKPGSIKEAAKLFSRSKDAVYLAGGHTLLPSMKQRLAAPADVIDLAGIKGLNTIKDASKNLTIGALTKHDEVATSAAVRKGCPALAALAGGIGDAQVRNCGTLGGSVANNDPAADYPAAVLGLGAEISTNARSLAADDFFKGMFTTALKDGELITAISFPKPEAAAYVKFPNPASRYAMVGVFVAKVGGAVRVAITGASPCVFRATAMEDALNASFEPAALDAVQLPEDMMLSDLHASAAYRAHLCTVIAKQAVAALA